MPPFASKELLRLALVELSDSLALLARYSQQIRAEGICSSAELQDLVSRHDRLAELTTELLRQYLGDDETLLNKLNERLFGIEMLRWLHSLHIRPSVA